MTSDDLRQLAARVAHDMPVSEVRDVIPGKLLEAAAELDRLAARAVPEGMVAVPKWLWDEALDFLKSRPDWFEKVSRAMWPAESAREETNADQL